MLQETPDEIKAMQVVERRRKLEEERKKRIFNPKLRTKGIDMDAIAVQIRLKKEKAEAEKRSDNEYAEKLNALDKQLQAYDKMAEEQRREVAKGVDEYRTAAQKKESRREYWLSDPDQLKKDLPGRVGDEDKRLGPSSGQVFEGEDLSKSDRVSVQQQQMREWVAQQVAEKEAAKQAIIAQEENLDKKLLNMDMRNKAQADHVADMKRKQKEQVLMDNIAIMDEIKARQQLAKAEELSRDQQELEFNLSNKFLKEDRTTTVRGDSEGRYIPYNFKGFGDAEKKEILDTVNAQLSEKEQQKQAELSEKAQWEKYERDMARQLEIAHIREERERRQKKQEYAGELNGQKEEYHKKTESTNQTFANKIDDGYFQKFGTTSR